jgi:RHS repeat-associated protein
MEISVRKATLDDYRCNGLSRDAWGITGCKSDRVSQTVNGVTTYYTLDQAAGLTQVLEDGANAYLYGAGRIAQVNTAGTEYFLGDALGSVRQMTDAAGAVTLAKAYDPYGVALQSIGNGLSNYGFTGELSDSTGLLYLRARYYAADTGRFISRDPWPGQSNRPLSLNRWAYVEANPINLTDPSGLSPYSDADIKACISSPKLNGLRTPMKESVCGMIAELKEEGYLMADMAYDVHIESAHRSPRDAHRYSTAWHILYDFVSIEDLRKTPKDLDGNVWYKDWWDGIYCATDENTYGNYGVGSYLYLVPDARRGLLDYYIKKNASDLSPETYREGRFGIKYITTKYGWSVPDHYYALEGWVGTRRLPNSSYPDVSKHVTGWAVDISRKTLRDDIWGQGGYTVIDEIADRYGLTRPYNNQEYVHYMPASDRHKLLREWWHFER